MSRPFQGINFNSPSGIVIEEEANESECLPDSAVLTNNFNYRGDGSTMRQKTSTNSVL